MASPAPALRRRPVGARRGGVTLVRAPSVVPFTPELAPCRHWSRHRPAVRQGGGTSGAWRCAAGDERPERAACDGPPALPFAPPCSRLLLPFAHATDTNIEKSQQLAEELGGEIVALAVQCDVRQEGEVEAFVKVGRRWWWWWWWCCCWCCCRFPCRRPRRPPHPHHPPPPQPPPPHPPTHHTTHHTPPHTHTIPLDPTHPTRLVLRTPVHAGCH